MKILFVEDDSNKMQRITSEIHEILKDVHLTEARSYQSCVRQLMSNHLFLTLDMSYYIDILIEEMDFMVGPYSGRNILAEITENIVIPTVVINV